MGPSVTSGVVNNVCTVRTPTWVKRSGVHCGNTPSGLYHSTAYSTLLAAQTACIGLGAACSGVYDRYCDSTGSYYACTAKNWPSSATSCVWTLACPANMY